MRINLIFCLIPSLVCAYGNVSNESRDRRNSDLALREETRKIIINPSKLPGVADGKGNRCVQKVVNVTKTVYEYGLECKHVIKKKCHLTYITDYHPTSQQQCHTTYVKDCRIVFKPEPQKEKIKKCHTPYIRECKEGTVGPEVCTVNYEDHCETTYEKYEVEQDMPKCEMKETTRCQNKTIMLLHLPKQDDRPAYAVKEICEKWPIQTCSIETKKVEKVHPKTKCRKVPQKFCMPNNCKSVEGKEICHEEYKTVVQNLPQEECNLQPQENCETESVLVPRLVPKKNCIKVPKEICVNTKKNPKQLTTPVYKLWCYRPDDLEKEISTI